MTPDPHPTETSPRLGLALGAGGARGIAHVVVLQVLDELGVRPAALAGCSMGAVVAAAYAAGMPARDIRAHALRVLRSRRQVLGRILEARVGRFSDLLARKPTNPVLVDAELVLPAFWPEGLPDRFEDLSIPLAVVATDFNARCKMVIRSGSLRSAVAGSMAIPGLVKPVVREGRVLVDGGVLDPLPYGPLFGEVECIVANDVSAGRIDEATAVPDPLAAMLGAAQIMQVTIAQRMLAEQPPHLLLSPRLERFRLLDFFQAARILEVAEAGKEEIKREIAALLEHRRGGSQPADRRSVLTRRAAAPVDGASGQG